MNSIYRLVGVSKQAFHQRITRQISFEEQCNLLLEPLKQIRVKHPRMSSRMMYLRLAPQHIGRDRFEAFCFENGFKVPVKRSFQKTTNSLGVTRFDNLLRDYRVTGINQVWVSDITYYRIGEKFYYLTFILDLYSRYIVGYSTSSDLSTENTTLPALRMALKGRPACKGLIIHSDGGGQYYCKEWLSITRKSEFRNSMCDNVYENPHAERINGTIKNDYLIPWGPENYAQLIAMNKKVVMLYNTERPHQSIGNITPAQFEKALSTSVLNAKGAYVDN